MSEFAKMSESPKMSEFPNASEFSNMSVLPKMQSQLATPQGSADKQVFAQVEKWMATIREIAGEHQDGAASATVRLERLLAPATE
jgi:hypothetical protein